MILKDIDKLQQDVVDNIMKIIRRERKTALNLTKPFIQHFIDHMKGESKRGMEWIYTKGPFTGYNTIEIVQYAKALLKEMK